MRALPRVALRAMYDALGAQGGRPASMADDIVAVGENEGADAADRGGEVVYGGGEAGGVARAVYHDGVRVGAVGGYDEPGGGGEGFR